VGPSSRCPCRHAASEISTAQGRRDGKDGTTKERCAQEGEGRRIAWLVEKDSAGFARIIANWRAGFSVSPNDRGTVVTADSTFEPKNVLVRAMLPLIRRRFHQAQRAILAALKASVTLETAALSFSGVKRER
jgi:hypothetical protein